MWLFGRLSDSVKVVVVVDGAMEIRSNEHCGYVEGYSRAGSMEIAKNSLRWLGPYRAPESGPL